jgi:hypothetical protein
MFARLWICHHRQAIRSDGRFKAIIIRLVSKHGIKMKAAVAIQTIETDLSSGKTRMIMTKRI